MATTQQPRNLDSSFVSTPRPDPTALTNELVSKATAALREVIETRLNAMDTASEVLEKVTTRHADLAVYNSQTLLEEKIAAITGVVGVFKQTVNERFQLGDVQTEKAARDVKSAVDAAFAAAKEAVGEQNKSNALSITKSETAFTKQIDQLNDIVKSSVKTTDDKIDDLKERLVAMEGRSSIADPTTAATLKQLSDLVGGLKTARDEGSGHRAGLSDTGAFVLGGVAIVSVLIAAIMMFVHITH